MLMVDSDEDAKFGGKSRISIHKGPFIMQVGGEALLQIEKIT